MFGYQLYLFLFETHRIRRKKKKKKKKKKHHISLQLSVHLLKKTKPPPHGVPTELVIIPGDSTYLTFFQSMYSMYVWGD